MNDTTGVVVSVHPVWRSGAGGAYKYVRVRVEYDTDDGPEIARFEVMERAVLRVGSVVDLRRRRNGRLELHLPDRVPWRWRRDLTTGLLMYAGMILLVLLFAGGTYLVFVQNAKVPAVPRPSPSVSPTSPTSPAGPTGPSSPPSPR